MLATIETFADERTADLFGRGRARWLTAALVPPAVPKLEYVHLATSLVDLRTPPRNRLHALKGDRQEQHTIAIDDQWRVCFRFADGDAFDVEVCDSH